MQFGVRDLQGALVPGPHKRRRRSVKAAPKSTPLLLGLNIRTCVSLTSIPRDGDGQGRRNRLPISAELTIHSGGAAGDFALGII